MTDGDRPTRVTFGVFLLLAFGWSWAFWGPEALVATGYLRRFPTPPALGAFGPSVAGVVVVGWRRGRSGLVELARRAVDVDFPGLLWLAILGLFPALALVAAAASLIVGADLPTLPWAGQPVALPIAFGYILFLGGPLQEEFGWRGYALDPLVDRFGAVGGSVVLGVLWGLWHLPLFFIPSETVYYRQDLWGFVVSITLLSVVMTWLYDRTGGSLLAMLLVHASFNWTTFLLPVLETDQGALAFLVLQVLVTLAIVAAWRPSRPLRWPLGTA